MNWKDTLQKKLSQPYIDAFNEAALKLLNERGKVSAGEVFDNLPKKLKDIMNVPRVGSYLKKIPEVEYSGKPRSGAGHYTLQRKT